MDRVDAIMDFENGQLDNSGIVNLFADLISTGDAWRLQGSYGRAARQLIDMGYISENGQILRAV